MNNFAPESTKKREQFANSIRSEQRQKIFATTRSRLEQARRRNDEIEAAEAELELLQIFNNHTEEYERMMEMADKLEQEEREYEEYLAQLEEESINYEMLQRKKALEELKKEMLEHFGKGESMNE